jgi:predicted transcriptional regulator
MSGNIHDTKTDKIKNEVDSLQRDIQKLIEDGEILDDYKTTLQNRYKYLYKTSKSLFNFVYDNYSKQTFDQQLFSKHLNLMLAQIRNIQTQNISQYDASAIVGESLAKQYIPDKLLK